MEFSATGNSWIESVLPHILEITAGRVTDIEVERRSLQHGGDPCTALLGIGSVAHKIAGTADSFGFVRLGELARAVEEVCLYPEGADGDVEALLQLAAAEPAIDALVHETTWVLDQAKFP